MSIFSLALWPYSEKIINDKRTEKMVDYICTSQCLVCGTTILFSCLPRVWFFLFSANYICIFGCKLTMFRAFLVFQHRRIFNIEFLNLKSSIAGLPQCSVLWFSWITFTLHILVGLLSYSKSISVLFVVVLASLETKSRYIIPGMKKMTKYVGFYSLFCFF